MLILLFYTMYWIMVMFDVVITIEFIEHSLSAIVG